MISESPSNGPAREDKLSIRNAFLNLSLNKKLILMMLFLSSILLSILLSLYWQSEKVLIGEMESQTAELTKAIQVGVERVTASSASHESGLETYLKTLKSKGIKEVSVISNAEEIIDSTNPTKIGTTVSPKKKELIIKAQLGEQVSEESGRTYNVMIPVVAGKQRYGYIHLQVNSEDVSEIMKRNLLKRIGATLIVFAAGMALSIFLAFRYTQPIHNVVAAAKNVAAGNLEQNLPENRSDEIGDLTKSFNFMVQRLRENRRLEERLREAEHLSAIGQLSSSIAHEIRNPLNYISLCIDHIKEKYRPGNPEQSEAFANLISGMKQEIHRLDKLVNDFLDYGRPLKLNLQNAKMADVLAEIMEIMKVKAGSDKINIIENYEFLPELMMDRELIKTCFINVIANALQAMPDGGILALRTRQLDGRFVLQVSDTGLGISRENLARVFEPFFTTKNNGLGLGLAITKRVMEEHGGKIDFVSEEGRGSEVTLSIPLLNARMEAV